ncbi:hypothetical protein MOQ00_05560 [Stenotrophomonas maltophilia]|nr:hypothetical protein [Stenotrophomonas maltophilia]
MGLLLREWRRGKMRTRILDGHEMDWWNGISTCSPLGADRCVLWWDAWAVVAAVFGGIGSWLAAFATYLAVVRPARRLRAEELVIAETAMEHFAADLIEFRYRLGSVGFSIQMVKAKSPPESTKQTVRGWARHNLVVPELRATPETAGLVKSLNRLRRAIRTWLKTVDTFDMSPMEEFHAELAEYEVDALHSHFAQLMDEIRAMAEMIKPMAPVFRRDLDLVVNGGNNFLPMPSPPDKL